MRLVYLEQKSSTQIRAEGDVTGLGDSGRCAYRVSPLSLYKTKSTGGGKLIARWESWECGLFETLLMQ